VRSGECDRLVQIQQAAITRDSVGGHVETWATIATVWAKLRWLRGSTLFTARAVGSSVSLIVSVRYRTDVTADMRVILDDGSTCVISHILPIGRREKLDLYCDAAS